MLLPLPRQRIYHTCASRILCLSLNGLNPSSSLYVLRGKSIRDHVFHNGLRQRRRYLCTTNALRASVEHREAEEEQSSRSPAQVEAIVRQARQTFGDTLPKEFLSTKEYAIYERLYGPPSAATRPEDIDLLQGIADVEEELPNNVLLKENEEGELEEVVYDEEEVAAYEEDSGEKMQRTDETGEEFRARMAVFRDMAAGTHLQDLRDVVEVRKPDNNVFNEEEAQPEDQKGTQRSQEHALDEGMEWKTSMDEGMEWNTSMDEDMDETGEAVRAHRLTRAGRSGTYPSTLPLSKDLFVDPITALLANVSNKQLREHAVKLFGGPDFPYSATGPHIPPRDEKPIALEASQSRMGEMDGNAFMTIIMPAAYATIMSTLVEVRKRLGSDWLRDLMAKEGGPRVLDAGAGGAGVLAWREALRAEWEAMHPNGPSEGEKIPHSKSTVVTGSTALRNRASYVLDDTTFIPRLPDYNPARDHPSLEAGNPQPRKQYDIIFAPYTLWTLKEDYLRKNQVQNFWSLLDPKGGVLILIEKGVPRGFELIAAARETLLSHHINSPLSGHTATPVEDASENRFGPKEKGIIIAPCTNHGKCPMYLKAENSWNRRDYCHFLQRYHRPSFYQLARGSKSKNHEDVAFSYVALQRGVDLRETEHVLQGRSSTALEGFEDQESADEDPNSVNFNTVVNPLSFPRIIFAPMKRQGHVILDMCTPQGKFERWTVPKSFSKQAYRDARKSKWGDLWGLGAKTAIPRKIRVGKEKAQTKRKDVAAAAAAKEDEDQKLLEEEMDEARADCNLMNRPGDYQDLRDRKDREDRKSRPEHTWKHSVGKRKQLARRERVRRKSR
ncbi:37S ribosomal protein S22 [Puttea exsequens]|nr:37S ribosomal protein S22 [Puttea exsequens]